jgi:lambda family phage minor tail protein L
VIQSEVQKLSPTTVVSLFQLDTSVINGPVLYFCMGSQAGGNVSFNGQEYVAVDISFDGMETNGIGALPTPTMRMASADPVIQSAIYSWGDISGAALFRYRTFARFLDGQPEADGGSFFGPDIFRIERKSEDTKDSVAWDLSASIDQEGKMLPGRPAIRATCLWRYRTHDAATGLFDYSKALCPYTGGDFFDELDQPTTAANDKPSRTLNCCKLRFGVGQPLPFGGFPGMRRSL